MPSERFQRLSKEKREVIRRAIMKEYTRVPIDKVSINKIIKDADISRGSFYTYFDDKWDILSYIFEDAQKSLQGFCMESLELHEGNVWNMLVDFLVHSMEFCHSNDTFEFIKNILEHARPDDLFNGFASRVGNCEKDKAFVRWLYERVDMSEFRYKGLDEFSGFLEIVMSSIEKGLMDFYQRKSMEQVKEEFVKKLELIRYGVCPH